MGAQEKKNTYFIVINVQCQSKSRGMEEPHFSANLNEINNISVIISVKYTPTFEKIFCFTGWLSVLILKMYKLIKVKWSVVQSTVW